MDPREDNISKYFTSKWRPLVLSATNAVQAGYPTGGLGAVGQRDADSSQSACPAASTDDKGSFSAASRQLADTPCWQHILDHNSDLASQLGNNSDLARSQLGADSDIAVVPSTEPRLEHSPPTDEDAGGDGYLPANGAASMPAAELEERQADAAIDKLLSLTTVHSAVNLSGKGPDAEMEALKEILLNRKHDLRKARLSLEALTSEESLVLREIAALERLINDWKLVKEVRMLQEIKSLTECLEDIKEKITLERKKEDADARFFRKQEQRMTEFENGVQSRTYKDPQHPRNRHRILEQEVSELRRKLQSITNVTSSSAGTQSSTAPASVMTNRIGSLKDQRENLLRQIDSESETVTLQNLLKTRPS